MALGKSPEHADRFRSSAALCEEALGQRSICRLLHVEPHRLFPDESVADLFTTKGRRSIPPRMVAVVMGLQRFEGLSDREAVEHFLFDLRWRYAAGGLDYDHGSFVHTVLVDMRARLRASARPGRIFEAVLDVAEKCHVPHLPIQRPQPIQPTLSHGQSSTGRNTTRQALAILEPDTGRRARARAIRALDRAGTPRVHLPRARAAVALGAWCRTGPRRRVRRRGARMGA